MSYTALMPAPLQIVDGTRFGKLVVVNEGTASLHHQRRFWCQCDCGTLKLVLLQSLTKGLSRSCGCSHHEVIPRNRLDVLGSTYGRLTVIDSASPAASGN